MTPTERAAMMIELLRFPYVTHDVSPTRRVFPAVQLLPAPQAQFDAFADVVAELYRKHGKGDVLKSGRTRPFSKKTPKLIRAARPAEFERAMKFAVRDLGRLEQLLTLKILIFT